VTISQLNPTKEELAHVARSPARYWVLTVEAHSGPVRYFYRETYDFRCRMQQWIQSRRTKYVLDVISGIVMHSTMTLRELETLNRLRWPLKEKMLERIASRSKAKKLKRAMGI
jgi:hypothetical protein